MKKIFFSCYGLRIGWVMALIAAVTFMAIFVIAAISLRVEFPGEMAEIGVLRDAVNIVDGNAAEDVLGLAVKANVHIARRKVYNQMWWSAWMIPNGWDNIEPIDIAGNLGKEKK